jgi:two-component system, LuxR family, response regulator FixJ
MTLVAPAPTVFVVEDDDSVRRSLELLIASHGYAAEGFASAGAFLDRVDLTQPGCLILDVRMPGMDGLELQRRLLADGCELPIIFITAHGDVPMAVDAVKAGAIDFLQKPFRDDALLDKIAAALAENARLRVDSSRRRAITERVASLTPREHEVMGMVVAGHSNKVIALRLGVSERTVEIHRSRVMHKMEATALAHLVRMVAVVEGDETLRGQP